MKYKNRKTKEIHICSICGDAFLGYGNNAQPVNDGRCCDECNIETVIPYRIYFMKKEDRENEKNTTSCNENQSYIINSN